MAVVEAMLAGCIPVVSDRGALPEVVGDAGIVTEGVEPGGDRRRHPPRAERGRGDANAGARARAVAVQPRRARARPPLAAVDALLG